MRFQKFAFLVLLLGTSDFSIASFKGADPKDLSKKTHGSAEIEKPPEDEKDKKARPVEDEAVKDNIRLSEDKKVLSGKNEVKIVEKDGKVSLVQKNDDGADRELSRQHFEELERIVDNQGGTDADQALLDSIGGIAMFEKLKEFFKEQDKKKAKDEAKLKEEEESKEKEKKEKVAQDKLTKDRAHLEKVNEVARGLAQGIQKWWKAGTKDKPVIEMDSATSEIRIGAGRGDAGKLRVGVEGEKVSLRVLTGSKVAPFNREATAEEAAQVLSYINSLPAEQKAEAEKKLFYDSEAISKWRKEQDAKSVTTAAQAILEKAPELAKQQSQQNERYKNVATALQIPVMGPFVAAARAGVAANEERKLSALREEVEGANKQIDAHISNLTNAALGKVARRESVTEAERQAVEWSISAKSAQDALPSLKASRTTAAAEIRKLSAEEVASKAELEKIKAKVSGGLTFSNGVSSLANSLVGTSLPSDRSPDADPRVQTAQSRVDAAAKELKTAKDKIAELDKKIEASHTAIAAPIAAIAKAPAAASSGSPGTAQASKTESVQTSASLSEAAQKIYTEAGNRVNELSKFTSSINGVELDAATRAEMAKPEVKAVKYVYHNENANDPNARNARDLFVIGHDGKATYLTSIGVEKGAEKVELAPVATKPVAPVTREVATKSVSGSLLPRDLLSSTFPICDPKTGKGCTLPAVPAQASVPTGLPSFRLAPGSQSGAPVSGQRLAPLASGAGQAEQKSIDVYISSQCTSPYCKDWKKRLGLDDSMGDQTRSDGSYTIHFHPKMKPGLVYGTVPTPR